MDNRIELYQAFQAKFPLVSLNEMTLENYTNLNRDDSFCYWVESRTENLGSIWGGTSYKFGIYRYKNKPNDTRIECDDAYAWYKKYNKATAAEAYQVVLKAVVSIATNARNGNLEAIDADNTFGEVYKWKIAFLYSDFKIIPIYNKDMLNTAASHLGMKNAQHAKTSEIQNYLMSQKGDKELFAFYDELLNILKKNKEKTRYWLYSPDENMSQWQRCQDESIMCLGWDELSDYSQYKTEQELLNVLKLQYNKPKPNNDKCAIWDFLHKMKLGDIVFVKKGLHKIVGRGIVESEYGYDADAKAYKNFRKVKWTDIREYEVQEQLPIKTLTDITSYKDWVLKLNSLFDEQQSATEPNYWWLVAKPSIWSLMSLPLNEVVNYTLYNENGNKRRVPENFINAKKGDKVIGYEATPTKQIVALLEIEQENDGENIYFKKTETLKVPIDYTDIKGMQELQQMEFIKNPNGSFFKLSADEYHAILQRIRMLNPTNSDEPYTEKQFLEEVYLNQEQLASLCALLKRKKNVILQGAPGVGKTFAARRLAYLMIGAKDNSRVKLVQFHQNYTYEDFIMGYKPDGDGFQLRQGVFYNFCRKAQKDPNNSYFFIIDEINRGNLSKIFGELLMLIENNYRGEKHAVKLAYNDEEFFVPENLYIIGMMNTADRSLAMIDYALRRRFSFFTMAPGFDSEGFKKYQSNLKSGQLDHVIDAIKHINDIISDDDSLGEGFCIGHSYFCEQKEYDELWLQNVVRFDIIPLLQEYWFDNPERCNEQIELLKKALL